jgi:tRNA threonylcarbamoyladenosine biosynthesis protein TsaB
MRTILAIDTSSDNGSVALLRKGKPIVSRSGSIGETYSTRLFRWLEEIKEKSADGFEELDGVAVTIGPGSFTGLRIGVAAAKGISLASGCPIFPFSTLAAMTIAVTREITLRRPLLLAGRGEVYTALYDYDGAQLTLVEREMVIHPSELQPGNEKTLLFGDGISLCREAISGFPSDNIEVLEEHPPLAPAIAFEALRLLNVAKGITPKELKLNYIRLSDAEAARK